jgi:hypothetical protein
LDPETTHLGPGGGGGGLQDPLQGPWPRGGNKMFKTRQNDMKIAMAPGG